MKTALNSQLLCSFGGILICTTVSLDIMFKRRRFWCAQKSIIKTHYAHSGFRVHCKWVCGWGEERERKKANEKKNRKNNVELVILELKIGVVVLLSLFILNISAADYICMVPFNQAVFINFIFTLLIFRLPIFHLWWWLFVCGPLLVIFHINRANILNTATMHSHHYLQFVFFFIYFHQMFAISNISVRFFLPWIIGYSYSFSMLSVKTQRYRYEVVNLHCRFFKKHFHKIHINRQMSAVLYFTSSVIAHYSHFNELH